jgi:hypothetical protein
MGATLGDVAEVQCLSDSVSWWKVPSLLCELNLLTFSPIAALSQCAGGGPFY